MRTRIVAAAVAAAIATASLAGCTSSGGSATSAAGSASGARPAAAAGTGAADLSSKAADRSVVTTGTLHLVDDSPVAVADRITDLVESAGGHVASSTEDPTGRPSAALSVRIPADAFPRTLAAIERTARLRDVSVRATDVTSTVTDYGVRVANLRTSITRLQQLLSKATSSADLVQIESSLTDRQGSLEQLLAQQRTLSDQVEYATLSVSVVVPAAAPPSAGPATFLGGLATGATALVRTAAALAVGLGILLPWALALAVIGAVVGLVVRAVRRRRTTSA